MFKTSKSARFISSILLVILLSFLFTSCGTQQEEQTPAQTEIPIIEDTRTPESTPDIELDGMWLNDRDGVVITFLGDTVSFSMEGSPLGLDGTFSISDGQIEMLFEDGNSTVDDFEYADNSIYLGSERLIRLSADEIAELQAEPTISQEVFEIGETATIDNWEITVNSFEFKDMILDGRWEFAANDGHQFLYVDLTVTNIDTTPRNFINQRARGNDLLVTSAEYDDDFTFGLMRLRNYGNAIVDMQIAPLATSTGAVTYHVADRVAASNSLLQISFLHISGEVIFNLR